MDDHNSDARPERYQMFGIGMPELLLILAVALIIIGPKKLPDLARGLGKALGEFKKATSELKESMDIDAPLSDVKRSFDNLNKDLKKDLQQKASGEKDSSKKLKTPTVQVPPEPYVQKTVNDSDEPKKMPEDGRDRPDEENLEKMAKHFESENQFDYKAFTDGENTEPKSGEKNTGGIDPETGETVDQGGKKDQSGKV